MKQDVKASSSCWSMNLTAIPRQQLATSSQYAKINIPWAVACGCRQLLTVAVELIAKTLVTQARDNSVIPGSHQYIGLHFILGPNFQGPNFEGPWKLLGEFGIQYCIKTSLWFLLFGSRPMQLPSVYTEDADLSGNIHQLPTKWQWNSKMKKTET